MYSSSILSLALVLPLTQAAESVLGVYIFSRHGDRTSKSTPPTVLTDLGYEEVFTSGSYFRDRYVASGASNPIAGISNDVVKYSQITASAPYDTVLMPSTQGFLQGLYPPVGETAGSQTLRNGTTIQTPLNGYQLLPIQTVTSGTGSENQAWLQGSSNCAKALASSNEYFSTSEYMSLLNSTAEFYKSLSPVVNATFSPSYMSYKNAYTIFDLINVAEIHNATIPSSQLITNATLLQIRTLADIHEFNLAYNASDPIRAITGSTMAAQIVQALNLTITGKGANKINIQFGAYGGFQSFFGLANLTQLNPDFYGIPDYASTMTFELVTNASVTPFPSAIDISVRFLFHNATTSNESTPVAYPLFGQSQTVLPWTDFVTEMNKFAIGSQSQWCQACGNSTGACAASVTSGSGSNSSTSSSSPSTTSSSGGVSKAVAGVIGAMVTLAVILGLEALIMLVSGLRLVSKKRLGGQGGAGTVNGNGNGVSKA
ncbi:hypothetical protein MMC14_009666 [Varicellaria rhodocarpa]|nr:hypothetical protein [Varicellaria rhodocarpa]